MRVEFYDLENKSNPLNGSTFDSHAELLVALKSLRTTKPFFCELVGENGRNLMVGVGAELGCAQYSSADGGPPCLVAVSPVENAGPNQFLKFFAGGQPSEVPARHGLQRDVLYSVAGDFLRTGEPSPLVLWEEW
jgi:hypothetical protein